MSEIKLSFLNWQMIELEKMKLTGDWDHKTRAKYGHAVPELVKNEVISASEMYQ